MTYAKKSTFAPDTDTDAETQEAEAPEVSEVQESAPDEVPAANTEQMKARIAELEAVVQEQRVLEEAEEGTVVRFGTRIKEGTVLRDPFSSQNPVAINEHPPGYRLSWCNPMLREKIGWKGWTPVTYDSEIGQNLSQYLNDPPAKMEGISYQDNFVRRGKTSILSALPYEVWLHRQIATEELSAQRMRNLHDDGTSSLRPDGSVVITGEGLKDQERPEGGFRFKHEQGERIRASGPQKIVDFLESSPALHNE